MGFFIGFIIFFGFIFWILTKEDSPEEIEKKRLEEKQFKNELNLAIKQKLNRIFYTSIHIRDCLAIDKSQNIIYLTYKKNTMDYICVIPVSNINYYKLEKEYSYTGAGKKAAVGALIGGVPGAIIGASSGSTSSFTGMYSLYIYFKSK